MKDLCDKIAANDRQRIETEIANVKSALEGGAAEAIKSATEKLTEVSYDVFGKVYQQEAAQNQGTQAQPDHTTPDDAPIDAEYEVVDDTGNNQ
ncbi:MAG: hypothetical protein GX802_07870 [Clostridiales bacterium]|jgi:molecular chaperone DnaK|nr:hypothetical protein [Clostridiales bacterium]